MFQEENEFSSEKLEKGHQQRFEARLDMAFPQEGSSGKRNRRFIFLKIAAVLVVAFGIGLFFLAPDQLLKPAEQVVETEAEVEEETEVVPEAEYQLSEVSPEFKKVEDYYLASLNIELAKLEVNDENKALVDAFMAQLAELDKEYGRLNAEISENGLNQQSVEAMIANLQLRLELLYKLKNKINEINQSQNSNYENLQA